MTFQIHGIDPSPFRPLFQLNNAALEAHHARWETVQSNPGYPCRVSLEDAPLDSPILLVNYMHQQAASPYRSSHAIYINPNASPAALQPGEVPESLSSRLLSWRAFDAEGFMLDADVLDGRELASTLNDLLPGETISEIHLHHAKPGCYAARVTHEATS